MSWKTPEQAEAGRRERAAHDAAPDKNVGEARTAHETGALHVAHGAATEPRGYRRYHAPLEARLLVDGAPWHCRVHDISVDGAGLDPAIPAALGCKVELHIPDPAFATPLPGRVINVAMERTCLAFDLDDAAARALTIYLASNLGE